MKLSRQSNKSYMETWYVGCFYLISLNLEIRVLFHFSWLISLQACQLCWSFWRKRSQFWFHWFSVLISYFQFDWFLLIVSFSSTYFGVNLLFHNVEMYVTDFRPFFFSSICIQCYNFPSKDRFCHILQILISYILIFKLKNILKFIMRFHFLTYV